jgi:predicted MPP superfamily phosphohydrolase
MLKIVSISDTHSRHSGLVIPECDLLLFGGDSTSRGSQYDFKSFLEWFSGLKGPKYKVFIAGNHDLCFEQRFDDETKANTWLEQLLDKHQVRRKDKRTGTWLWPESDLIYLEDTNVVLAGLKIHGSPWTPWFHGDYWAFNKRRGEDIAKVWEKIPLDTDILVTHGPAEHILDFAPQGGYNVGCHDLIKRIEIVKPKLHVFGHIHNGYGELNRDKITFINASVCDELYRPVNKPILSHYLT